MQCEDGSDLTPEQLMVTAANKHKNLVLAKMHNHPAQDQERILALETKLKKHRTNLMHHLASKNRYLQAASKLRLPRLH